jgi:HTH-type transcriptional regulator, sugar sensing transcriptional regulator
MLRSFGLTEKEASIYILISKHGAIRSNELAKHTKTDKAEIYRILTSLQGKGIIEKTLESPTRFTAMPFEKVVDSYIKNKRDEANIVEKTRNNLLDDWKKITKTQPVSPLERFIVVEGWRKVYPRIFEMVKETKRQLSCISSAEGLLKAEQYGLSEAILAHPNKEKIEFRFITEVSNQNMENVSKLLKLMPKNLSNVRGRKTAFSFKQSPRMVIKDDEEIFLFINSNSEEPIGSDDVALWTNCKTIVQSFNDMFEDLWKNSEDLAEPKDEKFANRECMLAEPNTAEKEYIDKLNKAKSEVTMITSSNGFAKFCKNKQVLKRWIERGISVKIMAPIVRRNFGAAKELARFGLVRHVPENYVGVTIIDGKEVVQFNSASSGENDLIPQFISTNIEYVEKMRNNLNDLWDNAQPPSSNIIESITGITLFPLSLNESKKSAYQVVEVKPPGAISEKTVLNKINSAVKCEVNDPSKDVNIMYGSAASAIINPPVYFNLPKFLFSVNHIEKQSSLGEGDALEIHLWLETPKGYAFVISGGLGDNPRGVAFRKAMYKGTPFEENYQLVDKDKLQVRVYGNNLFVGWTVPIPLLPPKYVLPPGCIIFEGYGKVKTKASTFFNPSGTRNYMEQNWFDAFVTFMHPESKYSGPGTDGAFARDIVITMTPPGQKKN